MLKIDRATSSGSCGKYMKYIGFPWPPVVAAHDRKRLPEHCIAAEGYWLQKNYPYTHHPVMLLTF